MKNFSPVLLAGHIPGCKAFAQAADTKDPRQKVLHALPHGGGTLGMRSPSESFKWILILRKDSSNDGDLKLMAQQLTHL